MELVLRSAIRAIDDLKAPGIFKLFFMCFALTAGAVSIAVMLGVWGLKSWLAPLLPNGESVDIPFVGGLIDFVFWAMTVAATVVPAFLIFWSLMIFIASFFDEHIARKIEEYRYPKMAVGTDQPFWPELRQDILFIVKTVLLNLLLIVIPVFWPFWPLLFPALNAYLLGMYFFMMAGGRHIGKQAAKQRAKQHRLQILGAGLLIVLASGIPILNFIVPFWGVAMMVHLYHLIDHPQVVETESLPAMDN